MNNVSQILLYFILSESKEMRKMHEKNDKYTLKLKVGQVKEFSVENTLFIQNIN